MLALKALLLTRQKIGVVFSQQHIIKDHQVLSGGPVSSVGIATELRTGQSGIESRWDEIFRPSRPSLGPTQPPVKWVPVLSEGKVGPGRAAEHSPPSSTVVMEE